MERFGYFTGKGGPYSDSGDRYGFDHSSYPQYSSIPTNDFSLEKKPHFKITVSSTGKVEEKPLPPIQEKRSSILVSRDTPDSRKSSYEDKVVLSINDLEKAFASPWMQGYKHLGESLFKALRDEPFPNKNYTTQPFDSGYMKSQPYFVGCLPDPRNTTTFNGQNIYISLYITRDNQIKKSFDILPFGTQHLNLPNSPITFTIHEPEDNDYIGKAYGQIIEHRGETLIRLSRLEDFAKNKLTWDEIPVGSHLTTTLNIEGSIPSSIQGEIKRSKREDSLLHSVRVEQLHQVDEDNFLAPHFEGSPPSERNYFQLEGDQVEAYLEITVKPPGVIILPVKDHEKSFLANIVDRDDQLIAHVKAHLSPEGKVDLGEIVALNETNDSQKQLTWQEIPAHGLLLIIELKS